MPLSRCHSAAGWMLLLLPNSSRYQRHRKTTACECKTAWCNYYYFWIPFSHLIFHCSCRLRWPRIAVLQARRTSSRCSSRCQTNRVKTVKLYKGDPVRGFRASAVNLVTKILLCTFSCSCSWSSEIFFFPVSTFIFSISNWFSNSTCKLQQNRAEKTVFQ